MRLRRTSNAGMLIEIDNISILLDGVAKEFPPYEGTPIAVKEELCSGYPDVVAFTHSHEDHCDIDFCKRYYDDTGREVYNADRVVTENIGGVELLSVSTRHIGKFDINHVSYVINGSKTLWFMGDASPSELKKLDKLQKPDVIIVPYAYTITEPAWRSTTEVGADNIILLHLPLRENDIHNLWSMTEAVTKGDKRLYIPEMGQMIEI